MKFSKYIQASSSHVCLIYIIYRQNSLYLLSLSLSRRVKTKSYWMKLDIISMTCFTTRENNDREERGGERL